MKKPIFLAGNADWLGELPSVFKKNNNTIHHSMKMTSVQVSKKVNEKEDYSNLQEKREKQTLKLNLNQLLRTADIKKVLAS